MAITVPRYESPTVAIDPVATPQASPLGADAFGAGLARGLNDVAQTGFAIAHHEELRLKGLRDEQKAVQERQQAELEKMAELRDMNKTKNALLDMDYTLTNHETAIVDNPDIPPEEYPAAIHAKGEELLVSIKNQTPEKIWLQMEPHFREQVYKSQKRMYDTGQKEITDQAWGEELVAADAIVNNPTKDAAAKIMLLKDFNFYENSGRPAHEVEAERQKRIALVANTEVKGLFNAAADNVASLRSVKDLLTKTKADGTPYYLPDMPQNDREDYRSTLQQKIKQAEHLQELEKSRQATEARQASQELITEYREKISQGWMPHTKDDYTFVKQVQRAASASSSLTRQYNDSTVKMTSFASREQFRTNDPLGTAAAEKGIILPPLNVTAPMGPQLQKRAEVAVQLGSKSLLKGDEINALAEGMAKKDAVSQVNSIKSLSDQLGTWSRATLSAAAEQLKVKDAGLSTMFKLASDGDMHAVKLYATGKQFLATEKKDFVQQKVTALKTAIDEKLEEKLGTALRALPQSRNAIKDATAIAYIGAATAQGLSLDTIDSGVLADVQQRIIGETVPTGNRWLGGGGSWKTTIIPRGMTSDQFLNGIKSITPVSIQLSGGVDGMTDEDAAKYLKKTAWHELGNGYGFYKDGKLLMGKDGKPFLWRQ